MHYLLNIVNCWLTLQAMENGYKTVETKVKGIFKKEKKAVYSCQANRLALKVARWKGILGMETQKPLPPYIIEWKFL